MRTPAMIALAAAAGFAAAWLLATQWVHPPAAPAPPAPIAQPVAAPPPPPPEVDHSPPPPPPQEPVKEAPPPEPPKPTAAPPKQEPPPEEAAASEETAADEPPAREPIDSDHAADLLADVIAKQEAEDDPNGLPNSAAEAWKKFDQETNDPEWSDKSSKQLEEVLQQWIDALPEDVRGHFALVHVECRTTLCQILAADNDEETQSERSQSGQEWQQAVGTLPSQPWWHELGFANFFTMVTSKDGTLLYITYILREPKPAA